MKSISFEVSHSSFGKAEENGSGLVLKYRTLIWEI